MKKPDICIYHHPCADGMTAAWAVWKRWGDEIAYMPASYNREPDLELFRGKHLLIVDFSYKQALMRQIAEVAASVTVLDHHESAERELAPLFAEELISGEFDMARSGAMMTWQAVWDGLRSPFADTVVEDETRTITLNTYPDDYVPHLVRYVQDRDLWRWELEESKAISAYTQLQPLEFAAWDKLAWELEDCTGYERAIQIGEPLVKREESQLAGVLKATKRRMRIAGYDVPVANAPYFMSSDGGNILCKGEPFAAIYFDGEHGRSFSLRSDKDDPAAVNVSLIAEKFGGGGHKHASGFKVPLGWEGDPIAPINTIASGVEA